MRSAVSVDIIRCVPEWSNACFLLIHNADHNHRFDFSHRFDFNISFDLDFNISFDLDLICAFECVLRFAVNYFMRFRLSDISRTADRRCTAASLVCALNGHLWLVGQGTR